MKKKTEKKAMDAVQFLRHMDSTQKIMESISDKSAKEYKVLQESEGNYGVLNEDGQFDMDNLLSVDLKDVNDVPKMYNSPVRPLNDGDKGLIADEFSKRLMNLRADVVDLQDIGPMSTAIAMGHGFNVTDVEGFINELIRTAEEKQDSQSIALGMEEVPGVEQTEETVVPPVDDVVAVGVVAPVEEPVLGDASLPVENPADMVADNLPLPEELPVEPGAPAAEVEPALPPVDDVVPPAPEVSPEQVAEEEKHVDMAEELVDLAEKSGDEKAEDLAEDLKEGEEKELAEMKGEEVKPESEELEVEDDEEEVKTKLEAIRANYEKKLLIEASEKKMLAVFESAKEEYSKTLVENVEPTPVDETVVPDATPSEDVLPVEEGCGVTMTKPVMEETVDIPEDSADGGDLFESLTAELNTIVEAVVHSEKARLESEANEKRVMAQLESIANEYNEKKNALVESVVKEEDKSVKLEAVANEAKTKLAARLEAKSRIDALKKK